MDSAHAADRKSPQPDRKSAQTAYVRLALQAELGRRVCPLYSFLWISLCVCLMTIAQAHTHTVIFSVLSQVHPDGSAFSYKYQPSVQDICALGQFT